MTETSVQPFVYGQFSVTRVWKASPRTIFAAWTDPAIKSQWFKGPPGEWEQLRSSFDFRVGGVEIEEGRFRETGMVSLYKATPHFIEPDQRLVYVYDMWIDGAPLSSSLATLLLSPQGAETKVVYSEQIVFLDGKDGTAARKEGTDVLFDQLGAVVGGKERRP